MLRAEWAPLDLGFRFEAVTSRERMWHRRTYLVRIHDDADPTITGTGECGLFRGLSADDVPDYEEILARMCRDPRLGLESTMPSVRFGFETAMRDMQRGGRKILWDTPWSRGETGIAINGLIWMGDRSTMARRIDRKLAEGFRVLKLKIGGICFDEECGLLEYIRKRYHADTLEIRLDANGSFTPSDAPARLRTLARYHIHSIEQPIRAGQPEEMARLCANSPLAIALDEELIGWRTDAEIDQLLEQIKPRYIILKPSLIGGFARADAYIAAATRRGIGWWATSALESNIGLNAIAQWVAAKEPSMPQGLGTGQLYTNNIPSPLRMEGAELRYDPDGRWGDMNELRWN